MNLDAYNSGAGMALKAFGIVNEQKQMEMMQQLKAQQMQNMQIENMMHMMQMQKIDAETKKTAQMEATGQKITELMSPTTGMQPQQKPFEEGGVAQFEQRPPNPLNVQKAMAMAAGLYPKEMSEIYAKNLMPGGTDKMPTEAYLLSLPDTDPKKIAYLSGIKQKQAVSEPLGGANSPEEAEAQLPDKTGWLKSSYQDLKSGKWRGRYLPNPGQIVVGYDANGNPIMAPSRMGAGGAFPLPTPSPVLPKPAIVPQAGMEDLTQGIQALRDLKIMEDTVSASGGVGGIANKAALNIPGLKAFNITSPEARAFETSRNRIRLSAQSMIKGIPSNYDVKIVLETLPDLTVSQEMNQERMKQTRGAYTSILKDTIAFHKGNNQIIPDFIANSAQANGIDVNSIRPWDGKTDPFQNTKPYIDKAQKILSNKISKSSTEKVEVRRGTVLSGTNKGKIAIEYSDGSRKYE